MPYATFIRKAVFILLFSALFIVFSLVQIKFTASPVPISLQTLAITLAGIFLKPKHAFISIAISIIIGLIGFPIFGGNGGIQHLLKPTGGFIVYFAFGAFLVSLMVHKWIDKKLTPLNIVALFVVYYVFGALASYLVGIPWFMAVLDSSLNKALTVAFYPFIIGDLAKALLALLITLPLKSYITKTRASLPL